MDWLLTIDRLSEESGAIGGNAPGDIRKLLVRITKPFNGKCTKWPNNQSNLARELKAPGDVVLGKQRVQVCATKMDAVKGMWDEDRSEAVRTLDGWVGESDRDKIPKRFDQFELKQTNFGQFLVRR